MNITFENNLFAGLATLFKQKQNNAIKSFISMYTTHLINVYLLSSNNWVYPIISNLHYIRIFYYCYYIQIQTGLGMLIMHGLVC